MLRALPPLSLGYISLLCLLSRSSYLSELPTVTRFQANPKTEHSIVYYEVYLLYSFGNAHHVLLVHLWGHRRTLATGGDVELLALPAARKMGMKSSNQREIDKLNVN